MPSDPSKRITQKDLAKAVGLHQTTVSMALRHHPSVSEETRCKVQKMAAELGYSPDPMMSALSSYRKGLRPAAFHGTLGWLANTSPGFNWRENCTFRDYLEGSRERAAQLGYSLEVIDLSAEKVSWKKAASILQARGVTGVLLCPQRDIGNGVESFPWEEFSVVKFGHSIASVRAQMIAPAQFMAGQSVAKNLILRGYKNIGYVTEWDLERRTGYNFLGGFLSVHSVEFNGLRANTFGMEEGCEEELANWIESSRLEALVVSLEYIYNVVRRLGFSIPGDLGVACTALTGVVEGLSGMVEGNRRIGAAATENLIAMLERGQSGLPSSPESVLIDGEWHEGNTLAIASV